jgi:hypothetical protein
MGALEDALDLSRRGDLDAAIRVLREVAPKSEAHWSLLWQLAPDLEVADAGCSLAKSPIARSTWALRRGLLHLEHNRKEPALADLQLVLKLRANDDHQTQARAALLQVAALKGGALKR